MKDSQGKEIKLGHLLTSSLFTSDREVKPLWVIEITEMTIVMVHRQPGSQPITLDQVALDNSYWVVSGFIKIEEKKNDKTK